jgi:hypothetical protein
MYSFSFISIKKYMIALDIALHPSALLIETTSMWPTTVCTHACRPDVPLYIHTYPSRCCYLLLQYTSTIGCVVG